MSTVTNIEATNNKLVNNYDVSKFLLGFNNFIEGTYTDSGAGSSLTEGLVMGRIQATSKLVPCDSAAVDGSQFPVGCLVEAKTVTAAATVTLTLVNKGRVASSKVTLKAGVALTADVDGRQLGDHLRAILDLQDGVELTKIDNQ